MGQSLGENPWRKLGQSLDLGESLEKTVAGIHKHTDALGVKIHGHTLLFWKSFTTSWRLPCFRSKAFQSAFAVCNISVGFGKFLACNDSNRVKTAFFLERIFTGALICVLVAADCFQKMSVFLATCVLFKNLNVLQNQLVMVFCYST